ncbi:MAG TPA: hypothetical protein DCW90_16840 [Lachnospiraceae bacterium]|nr:hypothetical protein [Lachnospiraceae bacterium]
MINYTKPYPVIGDLIKNKDYDYVSYRISWKDQDIFAGYFKAENGKIISLDGDSYDLDEEVIRSEEWNNPDKGVSHGLTVVVEGSWV